MTTRKVWDRKRNMVIAMAHCYGAPDRFIADVFDLPHSRVNVILRQLREEAGGELNREWVTAELGRLSMPVELARMTGKVFACDLGKDLANLKKRPNEST
jgi:hypothetical protein